MKVLIISPSWVGDMVMSQSLYRSIKHHHPDAQIDVMAPDWCRPLLNRMPEVSNILSMPLGHGVINISGRRKLGVALRAQHYDQAIVLPGSLKSALVPWFANIPSRTGWLGEMRYGLLNDHRKLDKQAFPLMVDRYRALGFNAHNALESQNIPEPRLLPKLSIDHAQQQHAYDTLDLPQDRPTLILCPGAEFGPAKRWPHYHYAELSEKMIEQGWQVWILGSAKDQEIGESIVSALSEKSQTYCYNLAGKTQLEQAIDLMAGCQAVVSNDSGLMHIAAAVDVPLVALYGPTSPQFTPPLSDKAKVIRLIDGFIKIRKGDAEQGYHQSLIDITPELVHTTLNELICP